MEQEHDSERRTQALLKAIPDLMFVFDREGTYLDYSAPSRDDLYLAPESFLGKRVHDILPPELAQATMLRIEQALTSHAPVTLEYSLTIQGEERFYEARIIELDADRVLTIVRDVTTQHRTADTLEEAKHFSARVANTIPNIIYVYDLNERRNTYINERGALILGYTTDEILAMGDRFLPELMHPDDYVRMQEAFRDYAFASDERIFEGVYRMRHRNGEWRWLHRYATVFARDANGRPTQILGAATDVTELKNAERQLQSLSARLLEVQDDEQRRIARELHDGPAQMLFGIGTSVARIREIPNLPAEAAAALTECQAMVDECLRDVRSLSYVLHHPLLDSAGLSAALKWFSDGFSRRSGIDVQLDIDQSLGRLPVAIERDLFRIAQEGLGNVARHSGSRRAVIRLERARDEVRLQIQDFGSGMRLGKDPTGSVPGVGITGMRERLRHLGGHLDLQSSSDGTSLLASVPLMRTPGDPQSIYAR